MDFELDKLIRSHFSQDPESTWLQNESWLIPNEYKNYFIHGVFDFLDENNITYAKHKDLQHHESDLRIQIPLNMSFFMDINNSFINMGRSLGYLLKKQMKVDEQIIFSDLTYQCLIHQNYMNFTYTITILPVLVITKKQIHKLNNNY